MTIPERRRREIEAREAARAERLGLHERFASLMGTLQSPEMVPAFRQGPGVVCAACATSVQGGHPLVASDELGDTLCTVCWERLDGQPVTPRETHMTKADVIQTSPVTSSLFAAIGYDEPSKTVALEYMDGHIGHVQDVPPDVFAAWSKCVSAGKYWYHHIRLNYVHIKVTGTCSQCGDIGRHGERCSECGCSAYSRDAKKPLLRRTRQ